MKSELDKLNRGKLNNTRDALIAETAIRRGCVLVTDDADLGTVTKQLGGMYLTVNEWLAR